MNIRSFMSFDLQNNNLLIIIISYTSKYLQVTTYWLLPNVVMPIKLLDGNW